jgi:hypothetical protein
MNKEEKEQLVSAWIRGTKALVHEGGLPDNHPYHEVAEAMYNYGNTDPLLCLELIILILQTDQSKEVQAILSAGPLEDLLVHNGEAVIDAAVDQAKKDEAFAHLLGGVWKNDISEPVWEKIVQLRLEKW